MCVQLSQCDRKKIHFYKADRTSVHLGRVNNIVTETPLGWGGDSKFLLFSLAKYFFQLSQLGSLNFYFTTNPEMWRSFLTNLHAIPRKKTRVHFILLQHTSTITKKFNQQLRGVGSSPQAFVLLRMREGTGLLFGRGRANVRCPCRVFVSSFPCPSVSVSLTFRRCKTNAHIQGCVLTFAH